MDLILDTSILIEIENDNKEIIQKLKDAIKDLDSTDLHITYFNFCEYFYGHIRKNKKNKATVLEKLSQYKLLNTTKDSGIIFCEIRNHLKGKPIPVFDLLSASIAIGNNLAFITADEHFNEIPGLRTIIL